MHHKAHIPCWACNGSGKKWPVAWENPLRNPPNFKLKDCLQALKDARCQVNTDFERKYLEEMIKTLNEFKS